MSLGDIWLQLVVNILEIWTPHTSLVLSTIVTKYSSFNSITLEKACNLIQQHSICIQWALNPHQDIGRVADGLNLSN